MFENKSSDKKEKLRGRSPIFEYLNKKDKLNLGLNFRRAYENVGKNLDDGNSQDFSIEDVKISNDADYFELVNVSNMSRKSKSNINSFFDNFFRNNIPRNLKNSLFLLAFAFVFVVFSLVTVMAYNGVQDFNLSPTNVEVKGASEVVDLDKENNIESDEIGSQAYQEWILEKNGQVELPQDDSDDDGLTNMEEFLIGTDPINKSTCGGEMSDSQKLINLVDPLSCEEIDVDDKTSISKYTDVVDLQRLKNNLYNEIVSDEPALQTAAVADVSDGSLISIFGAKSLEDLNGKDIDTSNIDRQIEILEQQASYVDLIAKIDEYIETYRSYEPFDRDYEIPVSGAVYLDVSIRYDTPLKYVLAIAQRESRFGTDRFTQNGNPTRPGQYQNIFSMGLDDSGNNIGFETWEKGVESFGKWYRRFDDAGVSDCRKWRIYNPNGDYCARVEETAGQIEFFLR